MLSFLCQCRKIRQSVPLWAAVCAWGMCQTAKSENTDGSSEVVRFYVKQYRVVGAHQLKPVDIEEAVYPYLGPARTPDNVEEARSALEKKFHERGYQTVSVSVPQQDPRRGVIRLEVVEASVGRVRVNGSKWYLPSRIREEVPSLAEGSVPDFNQVSKELMAINRLPDRRITPRLNPGVIPGTVDIDLDVEDEMPLHGSLELNNRYSVNTTDLRLNASLSYGNLFQLGHTLGFNTQIAPEKISDGEVYSAYYLARVSDKLSLMAQATKQYSDISTIAGSAVAGRGEVFGIRALFDLPANKNFYQSFNLGLDYKNFDEDFKFAGGTLASPIEYYPLSASYSAGWIKDKSFTDLNLSLVAHLRGLGSSNGEFDSKRTNSSGNFLYLQADASHTHDFDCGSQLYGKLQGQISGTPLVNNEQFSGGGLGTARGYLEATAMGDFGLFGTIEARSPSLFGKPAESSPTKDPKNEWRFHAFSDAGVVGLHDASDKDQSSGFASVGLGSRFKAFNHYHGSVDVALPLVDRQVNTERTERGDVRVTFRSWADF